MPRCMGCKRSLFKCGCNEKIRGKVEAEKAKTKITDSRGRTRMVTKNTGNTVRNGVTWCGTCSCQVRNGVCSNITCSSRKR